MRQAINCTRTWSSSPKTRRVEVPVQRLHPGFLGLARSPPGAGFRHGDRRGTVTGVCCESTARDAMMLNYKTIMVSDGNAAMSDAEHNASLTAFYTIFGDVMDTDMLVRCLHDNARPAAIQP